LLDHLVALLLLLEGLLPVAAAAQACFCVQCGYAYTLVLHAAASAA
jgi:hypothetical protein